MNVPFSSLKVISKNHIPRTEWLGFSCSTASNDCDFMHARRLFLQITEKKTR